MNGAEMTGVGETGLDLPDEDSKRQDSKRQDSKRMVFLTPTLRPAGGVVKIFDYAIHALEHGFDVTIATPEEPDFDSPIFARERFKALAPTEIDYQAGFDVSIEKDDFVFFSWPPHYKEIVRRLPPGFSTARLIHIVQGTRHGNPKWLNGYASLLLGRPMTRIFVSDEALVTAKPFLNPRSQSLVIVNGHDFEFFTKERSGAFSEPIDVGYTTWKSDVGQRVEQALAGDVRFRFRSISETVDWSELRDLYWWSDVFLGCPIEEEGFYLPGIEAFAAGALLVMPDVGGNMVYCRFDQNAIEVDFDDVAGYVATLERLAETEADRIDELRRNAYQTLENHTLKREAVAFEQLLSQLDSAASSLDSL